MRGPRIGSQKGESLMTDTQRTSWTTLFQGKHWPVLGLLAASLLTLVATSNSLQAQGKDKRPALKVGLVDLGVVFNKYKKKIALENAINNLKDQYNKKIKAQNKLLRQLDRELEDLKGSKASALEDRIKLEMERRRIMKGRMERDLRKKLVEMTLKLLDDINKEIKAYGKRYGYTFILKVDNQGFGREEFREKIFRAQVQSVLYYDAAIDITQPILKVLNKNVKVTEPAKGSRKGPSKVPSRSSGGAGN